MPHSTRTHSPLRAPLAYASTPRLPQVMSVLRRKERWLVCAAIRFFRTMLSIKVGKEGRGEGTHL